MLKPVKILILLFILQLNMHLVYSTELDCNMGYFKGLYACGVLTLQNTVPPIISLASNFCEQQKVANNCNEIVKANPANEKFVVKCDPQSICSRTTYEAISPVNFVIKCLEGAGDFVEDWIKLYEFVAKKKDQRDAFYKVCNKDLACLRAFSRGVPEFDVLSDKELGAFNSVYIADKRKMYQNVKRESDRILAAQDYAGKVRDKKWLNNAISRDLSETTYKETKINLAPIFFKIKNEIALLGIKYDCYDDQTATRLFCKAALNVIVPGSIAKNLPKLTFSASRNIAEFLEKEGFKKINRFSRGEAERDFFILKNGNKRAGTNAGNAEFIEAAKELVPERGSLFVRFENAFLKMLNDKFKDKVFITSVNNKYNEILSKNIKKLLEKNSDIKIEMREKMYQGFKELEYKFTTSSGKDVSDSFKKELEIALNASKKDLDFYLTHNDIVRKEDIVSNWYRAGMGSTGYESNIAARVARDLNGNSKIMDFNAKEVQEKLAPFILTTKNLASEIEESFPKKFLDNVSGTKFKVVNEDILALIRKHSDPVELLEEIKKKTKNDKIPLETVKKMQLLQEQSELFSPPVRSIVRENAVYTLSDGTQIGIDYRDVGALNAKAQMQALLKSNNVQDAIKYSKNMFDEATKELERRKNQFEIILKDVHSEKIKNDPNFNYTHAKSGDDGVASFSAQLSQRDVEQIAKRWAEVETKAGKKASGARFSHPSSKVKDAGEKNLMGVHGESIEKELRKRLNGKISSDNFNDLTILVKMQGEKLGTGSVDIYIASGGKSTLTPDEIKLIANEFKAAVKQINTEGKQKYNYMTNGFRFD